MAKAFVNEILRIDAERVADSLHLGKVEIRYSEPIHDGNGNLICTPDVAFEVSYKAIVPVDADDLSSDGIASEVRNQVLQTMMSHLYDLQDDTPGKWDYHIVNLGHEEWAARRERK